MTHSYIIPDLDDGRGEGSRRGGGECSTWRKSLDKENVRRRRLQLLTHSYLFMTLMTEEEKARDEDEENGQRGRKA